MKVLVVVDMQNDFIDGALGSPEAQAIVDNVVKKISEFDGDMICLTEDTHQHDYLGTQEGKLLPVEHCIEESNGWMIHDAVEAASNQWFANHHKSVSVFKKDTFGSVDLGECLGAISRRRWVNEVVMIGLCTDICVISNALLIKAFLPEAKITVDASCCAGVTPKSHENALRAMQMCQVNIENWEG